MERYRIGLYTREDSLRSDSGRWVEWNDHEKEIARITDIYERRIHVLKCEKEAREQDNRKAYRDCNCAIMSQSSIIRHWVCPTHGFKKL